MSALSACLRRVAFLKISDNIDDRAAHSMYTER
jgi:hypothetical protein